MATDLTGDSELSEDEFDWDVFLPDPDEAQVAAEAAALEDEDDLDDSDFDWEAALREDSEPENGAGGGTRAGAAYDRIVDTVRRSVEEPEQAADTEPAPVALQESETLVAAELEPEAVEFVTALHAAREPEVDVDPLDGLAFEAGLEPDAEPEPASGLDSEAIWETTPEWGSGSPFVGETGLESEAAAEADVADVAETEPVSEPWLGQEQQTLPVRPDPDGAPFEPEPAEERSLRPFTEAAATAGAVGATEWPPMPSSEAVPTWAMAPAEPWEVGVHAEFAPDPVLIRTDDEGEVKKRRSRVFIATVVLACLFLAVVAAALAVRAMHHPTTTAGPPAQVTPPPHATPPVSSSSGAARIQTATDAVDSATTAASVGLTSLAAFPTPTNVEAVINPYISSLQLYEAFLSATNVPAPAQSAASSAEAQLRQNLKFLDTIDGLPPQQLGAFLAQFDSDATQLQTTLSTLEQNVRASAS